MRLRVDGDGGNREAEGKHVSEGLDPVALDDGTRDVDVRPRPERVVGFGIKVAVGGQSVILVDPLDRLIVLTMAFGKRQVPVAITDLVTGVAHAVRGPCGLVVAPLDYKMAGVQGKDVGDRAAIRTLSENRSGSRPTSSDGGVEGEGLLEGWLSASSESFVGQLEHADREGLGCVVERFLRFRSVVIGNSNYQLGGGDKGDDLLGQDPWRVGGVGVLRGNRVFAVRIPPLQHPQVPVPVESVEDRLLIAEAAGDAVGDLARVVVGRADAVWRAAVTGYGGHSCAATSSGSGAYPTSYSWPCGQRNMVPEMPS